MKKIIGALLIQISSCLCNEPPTIQQTLLPTMSQDLTNGRAQLIPATQSHNKTSEQETTRLKKKNEMLTQALYNQAVISVTQEKTIELLKSQIANLESQLEALNTEHSALARDYNDYYARIQGLIDKGRTQLKAIKDEQAENQP